jgi:hypothetical protein
MAEEDTRVDGPNDETGPTLGWGPGIHRPWSMTIRDWRRCPSCQSVWAVDHEAEWDYPRAIPCPACQAAIPLRNFPGEWMPLERYT